MTDQPSLSSPSSNPPGTRRADFDASWLEHCAGEYPDEKRVLGEYIATHQYFKYGDHAIIGSGTTLNTLVDCLFDHQITQDDSLDLNLLSVSMHVLERGAEVRRTHTNLFLNTQISLTGGQILPGLHSLIGSAAIASITSPLFNPSQVYFGAIGVCFGCEELALYYEFDGELSTQVAIANRVDVDHKCLLFAPHKLGRKRGWRADVTLDSLMRRTRMCTFVSILPESGELRAIVNDQVDAFEALLDSLVDKGRFAGQEIRLVLLNSTGEEKVHSTLSQRRAARAAQNEQTVDHVGRDLLASNPRAEAIELAV